MSPFERKLPRSRRFHYSGDYRIGTKYLGEPIMDNIKRQAMQVGFLRDLLRSDSIRIESNLTFANLDPLSTYLGTPGNPDKGGLPLAEYQRRQEQHRIAEIEALKEGYSGSVSVGGPSNINAPQFGDYPAFSGYSFRHRILAPPLTAVISLVFCHSLMRDSTRATSANASSTATPPKVSSCATTWKTTATWPRRLSAPPAASGSTASS